MNKKSVYWGEGYDVGTMKKCNPQRKGNIILEESEK